MKRILRIGGCATLLVLATACNAASLVASATGATSDTETAGSSGSTSTTTCTLLDDTTATSTVNDYGCALRTRDTSSCEAERTAQGLSGYWLKLSCNVTLTVSGSNVVVTTTNLPDTLSYYYDETDPCYEADTLSDRSPNPNSITSTTIAMTIPEVGTLATSTTALSGGAIGIAANGIALFSNAAAPGDDIYEEVATFDACDGHPQQEGMYHYHTEPSAISNGDDNFVGIMRDGFPIYGRYEHGTTADATGLDDAGGHTGTTADSPSTPVYHYHVNLQTNGTDQAYFVSTGEAAGTVGACTGCN